MSVSTRRRFAIFERDQFTCQYCGEKPPEVILHVDHMVSIKDGGGDEDENLITACRQCNLGKSAKSVDVQKIKKMSFKKELAELEEKKAQLEAYYEYIKKKKEMKHDEVNIFQRCWQETSNGESSLTEQGLENMRKLSQKYTAEMIFEAIQIAWNAKNVKNDGKFGYMCGVLKNMRLAKDDPETAERVRNENTQICRARRKFAYFDERKARVFCRKINVDNFSWAIDESKNWSEFRSICELYLETYAQD